MPLVKSAAPENRNSPLPHAEAVLHALNALDSELRLRAARAAAQFPECASALCARLALEPDRAVRAALLTALIKLQTPVIARDLSDYLHSEDAALRNEVISALQQMPQSVMHLMPLLLQHPDPDIRIFALNILGGLRDPQARDCILEVIAHDPHMNVCATALDALAEIGTPHMIPALQDLARRFDNEFIQFAVDVAIRRIGA